ncbi:Rne/Rng family ribonuclease [Brachybacterium nesterenkovii]|uniref:Rne/Rng family ribonuclease n=1 Tax=Brachybacterium nesterenkovii TaxID=47847 RepID=UPI00321B63BA
MAEDSRTPADDRDETSHGAAPEEVAEVKPAARRRRRAGAPVGAPAVAEPVAETPADGAHAPLTSVPAQESPVEVAEPAEPTRRSPRRRAASAPAGPPVIPVFSAAETAAVPSPAPAETDEADEDQEPASEQDEQTAQADAPQAQPAPAAATSLADDLAALAASAPGASREDDGERRERAQLDFASLLFQAPSPQAARPARDEPDDDASEDDSDDDPSQTADDEAEETQESSEADDEQTGSSSRRRRRRGGRGRRGRGRGDDDGATGTEDDSDEDEAESAEDEAEDSTDAEGEDAEGTRRSSGRSRSRGGRSRKRSGDAADDGDSTSEDEDSSDQNGSGDEREEQSGSSTRRRRRRRRSGSSSGDDRPAPDDPPNTVVKVRERRDEVKAVKGSTRLEAKKQRRREGRDAGRRRSVITEAEFLARRESVKRSMIVRERPGRTQIAVLEDDVLVEHYVAQKSQTSMVGNVYLGKVQNVLPSMEAAFVDIGKGRNAVLYAGEVNWDAAGLEGQPRRIELALKSGDPVLVQVTKDPIGHKGARLTSQISLPGRYVVLVPGGSMTGISRKLPDPERARLKKIMKQVIPEDAGVIVRTAAEGASEEELTRDVERLRAQWEKILKAQKSKSAPAALSQEPDIAIKVVRDVFNEDFTSLIVEGDKVYDDVHEYVSSVAPDLLERVTRHMGDKDVFAKHRVDEQLLKAMDRKVYLPSGGSLVIDRTEAMTVIDVNTGKFTGSGGSLEETVTRNNLEAAEEIVRQLRLRDTGGIIVIDFIDMVLESNRDLVLRRLVECLGRDRTKHQVAEVTSLGLVQMTRKRVGAGLVETFSTPCEACNGRGHMIDMDGKHHHAESEAKEEPSRPSRRRSGRKGASSKEAPESAETPGAGEENVHRLEEDTTSRELARATIASIAAATTGHSHPEVTVDGQVISVDQPEGTSGDERGAAAEASGEVTEVPAPAGEDSSAQGAATAPEGDAAPDGATTGSDAPSA